MRSYINATNRIEIDAFFRYVGALPQPAVDAYSELDARLGYRVRPGWDLSLIGNNLLHDAARRVPRRHRAGNLRARR